MISSIFEQPFAATVPTQEFDRDEHLRNCAEVALRSSGYGSLRRLTCAACDGRVVLTGKVPTYHLKQVAQAVIMRLMQVREVRNLLVVSCS